MNKKHWRHSKGKCLCVSQTDEDKWDCEFYLPIAAGWYPERCLWLDNYSGAICHRCLTQESMTALIQQGA